MNKIKFQKFNFLNRRSNNFDNLDDDLKARIINLQENRIKVLAKELKQKLPEVANELGIK